MKNKKSQIDMFGLVIIVVLLVVIALFSLFFITKTDEDRNIYSSLKAYNFANALSKASIDETNMEYLILTCCSGISSSCEKALNFAEDEFEKLDINNVNSKVKFELQCLYEQKTYSRGECAEGIVSESIILQSGDSIRVILCT